MAKIIKMNSGYQCPHFNCEGIITSWPQNNYRWYHIKFYKHSKDCTTPTNQSNDFQEHVIEFGSLEKILYG